MVSIKSESSLWVAAAEVAVAREALLAQIRQQQTLMTIITEMLLLLATVGLVALPAKLAQAEGFSKYPWMLHQDRHLPLPVVLEDLAAADRRPARVPQRAAPVVRQHSVVILLNMVACTLMVTMKPRPALHFLPLGLMASMVVAGAKGTIRITGMTMTASGTITTVKTANLLMATAVAKVAGITKTK